MKFKRKSIVIGLAVLLVLVITTTAFAQTYSFSVPKETVDAYWESDGTLKLVYEFTFANSAFGDPIDYIDIGMPNNSYYSVLSSASGTVGGAPITHIADSEYVDTAIELGLGSNQINPGETIVVHFEISGLTDVLYFDSGEDDYASAVFAPTWFDKDFVSGITDLTVTYHLPPDVETGEPRWHESPKGWPQEQPETGIDSDGRIYYQWNNPNANAYTQYLFGASFPTTYVPAATISTPTIWQNLGIDPEAIFSGMCICAIAAFFIGIPVLSIRSSQKRKMQYLPPKLALEGHGIKRGLTAIEAAILLEQPMDKILTMILFAAVKKGAAEVTSRDPLNIKILEPQPNNLRGYEQDFIKAMAETSAAKRKKALQAAMVTLVKSVSKAMKGFSQRETKKYYEKITEAAWKQVEDADTPEVKSETYDKVMEWTMLDNEYDDRTRRVFRNYPVFVPTWWHRYDPRPIGGGARIGGGKVGPTSSRPTPGGTKMPTLPGSDFAASVVNGTQDFAAGVIGSLAGFTSGVTDKTNPVPKTTSSGGSRSSGGSSCACACACAGCACACAGGGR